MPLDPNVAPHKTRPFWYIVALAVLVSVGYPLAAPSHGPLWLDVVPSVILSIVLIFMGWRAVRRIQRDLGRGIKPSVRPSRFAMIMLGLSIILFILSTLFRRPTPEKQVRPIEEKPDYIKKLEEWKP
jgi:hypothetical protein